MGRHSVDLFVVLAAFLTEFLLALAVLLKLRQPGVLARSQILFVLFTASGLALLACPAVLLMFSELAEMPVFLMRALVEAGMMLIILGAFFVFSSLRFADVLLKDVLHTYWWGVLLLLTWFGLQAILQLPYNTGTIPAAERGLLALDSFSWPWRWFPGVSGCSIGLSRSGYSINQIMAGWFETSGVICKRATSRPYGFPMWSLLSQVAPALPRPKSWSYAAVPPRPMPLPRTPRRRFFPRPAIHFVR